LLFGWEEICLFHLVSDAFWEALLWQWRKIHGITTFCLQFVETKPFFPGKYGQNCKQTLLVFSSQLPPFFSLTFAT